MENSQAGLFPRATDALFKLDPFLIKTLVIDDCGMTDDVFAELLQGLKAQGIISAIHYTNNNILGSKSAVALLEVCDR